MCNCIKEREAQIRDFVQSKFPKDHVLDSELQEKALVFTKEDSIRVCLHFETSVTTTLKNGKEKTKKVKTNLLLYKCPFCGIEYSKE